jgi:hypothetical protein
MPGADAQAVRCSLSMALLKSSRAPARRRMSTRIAGLSNPEVEHDGHDDIGWSAARRPGSNRH